MSAAIPDHSDRAAYIRGLRQLADFLEEHADVPAERFGTKVVANAVGDDADRQAQVEHVAALLGAAVVVDDTSWRVTVDFDGGVQYEALGLSVARMAAWAAFSSYSGSVQPESSS